MYLGNSSLYLLFFNIVYTYCSSILYCFCLDQIAYCCDVEISRAKPNADRLNPHKAD